jgi:hypothetical protein
MDDSIPQQLHEDDEDIQQDDDVYTIEDMQAEDELLDQIGDNILANLQDQPQRRRFSHRRYIRRPREIAHLDLYACYFSESPIYTDEMFRRRYRMNRLLFLRIVENLGEWSPYFNVAYDCAGRKGLTHIQKCTAAIRMLAYGTPGDELDENLKIAASTALECLGYFAKGVIDKFGEEYLRPPTTEEVEKILQLGETCGFPGMLGSIDCMHWQWEKCPVAWRGQFTRGDKGVPTMILEAVASKDLRIWHAFFGTAGSNNDINVLNKSPLFIQKLRGEAPQVQYVVNGKQYNVGYYLADGIYPEWAAIVKSIPSALNDKDKFFAQHQESERKVVECAFGVLQSRFNIIRRPARMWKRRDVVNIMQACVILHNMIVEDEKRHVEIPIDLNMNPGASIALPPEVSTQANPCFADVLRRNNEIRDNSKHMELKNDLVEHIWQRYGQQFQAQH